MAISQPPFQSTLVDADDRVQTPWAQWFSQLQPILQSVVASGPTSGRPTQNLFIGYPYFDTTIDQMVYWNGVIWVTYAPSTTGTSILKGNGTGGFNNAIAGADFAPATSGTAILYGNGAGGFSSVAIGTGVTFAGGVLSASGSGGTVTSVSGTAPIASSGGTTPAISISQAGISTNGYLSSTDWNTFNNKGSVTSVGGTGSANGITLTGTVTSSGSLTLGGTLGGIANSQLTNSSITINGNLVSLGGSTTVTATATNALTIGTGLSGTSYNGSTAVTIANTGVLSITGTALQITASASTGAVTLSLPSSINVNTTGYAAGLAGGGANYVPYQTAVNTTGFVSPGVVGQVFTSTGSGSAPNWQNATSPPGSPGYYGAWHDTTTVTATSTTTAYVMNIGSIDLENGTSIVGGTKITVANTGVYNLQFSAQLSNPNSQIADVSIWIRLNGVNVTDGAGTNGVPAKHGSNDGLQIISWNYVLNLTAGDYIELVWHSDTAGVQLITFPATTSPAVPESPSLIVTIQAVTQIGIGYQGLTSATSVLIATGSKIFTTNFTNSQTAFAIGTRVRVAYSSTPANFMEGVVTAFSGTTFTVLVDSIGGSGTFASWTISVAGIQGSNGVTSITGTANQVIASASTGAITLSLPQDIATTSAPTFVGTNFSGTATSLSIGGNAATASKWATARNLAGNSVDGSANIAFANKFIVQGTTDTGLTGAQFLGALGTGLVKNTTSTGILSIAASGTDYAPATSGSAILYGNGSGGFSSVTIGTGVSFVAGTLSATGSGGTVTSVAGTGTVNGITLTGTVTSSGSLTLGGTLGSIANSQLTNSSITFGVTAQALGSTVSALNAVTIGASSASTGAFTTLTSSSDATLHGLIVGLGGGSVATNTALGTSALNSNVSGANLTAVGYQAGISNTASSNTFVGYQAGFTNSTGTLNTCIGLQAGYNNNTNSNTFVGYQAGLGTITFGQNQFFGYSAGKSVTTGYYNTIIGGYTGAAAPISATGVSYTVLSDGAGNVRTYYDASGNQVNYGVKATSAAAPTIASATTIAPTKAITFISGVTPIATITAPSPISLGGGTITLIPTGIFTTTIAGNIALASTAVVGKALLMTYDATTAKWYPSY
jgi:hypothetical protein